MAIRRFSSTDPARIWEHLNRLADDIETEIDKVDTGWISISPASGFTAGSAGCAYRIINGICYLTGLITRNAGTFSSSYSTVMSLPTAARPSRTTEAVPFLTRTSDALGIVVVQTDGQVRVAGGGTPGTDRLALDSIRPYPVA